MPVSAADVAGAARARRAPCTGRRWPKATLRQSLGSAGVGSPGSERTCKDEALQPIQERKETHAHGYRRPGEPGRHRDPLLDHGAGQPAVGCDYDTFAADLPWTHADQVNATLLGFIHS